MVFLEASPNNVLKGLAVSAPDPRADGAANDDAPNRLEEALG